MNKTKIKKLVIELKGKDIELSLEQAKELQTALNELFEEKVKVEKEYVPKPYPVPEPYPVYPRPWRPYRPWREPWITWDSDIPLYKAVCGTNLSLQNDSVRFQLKS